MKKVAILLILMLLAVSASSGIFRDLRLITCKDAEKEKCVHNRPWPSCVGNSAEVTPMWVVVSPAWWIEACRVKCWAIEYDPVTGDETKKFMGSFGCAGPNLVMF